MASSSSCSLVDLNDECNLELYSQIREFKNDHSRNNITFQPRLGSEQTILHTLAFKLGLDYEYSKVSGTATISRPGGPVSMQYTGDTDVDVDLLGPHNLDFTAAFNPLDLLSPMEGLENAPVHDYSELFDFEQFTQSYTDLGNDFPTDSTVPPRMDGPTGTERYVPVQSHPDCDRLQSIEAAKELSAHSPTASGSAQVDSLPCPAEDNLPAYDQQRLDYAASQQIAEEGISFFDFVRQMLESEVSLGNIQFDTRERPGAPGVSEKAFEGSMVDRIVKLANKAMVYYSAIHGSSPLNPANLFSAERRSSRSSVRNHPSDTGPDRLKKSKRSSSSSSLAGFGYEEIVFDSKSASSGGSWWSEVSASSGRRGPLSEAAKAGMRALREVGNACWRCKYLKKPCTTGDPCGIYPKGGRRTSKWGILRCRRGDFQCETFLGGGQHFCGVAEGEVESDARISFLEATSRRDAWINEEDPRTAESHRADPMHCGTTADQDGSPREVSWRLPGVMSIESTVADTERVHGQKSHAENQAYPDKPSASAIRELFSVELSDACTSYTEKPGQAALTPLKECILAIVWELTNNTYASSIAAEKDDYANLIRLLSRAAVYQAGQENDQLIAQSLICLRDCLEVMRMPADSCRVDVIENLNTSISIYIKELSRVFFNKKNIKFKETWWLSAFYSFWIQTYVRKALIQLTEGPAFQADVFAKRRSDQYLYIPLRLFDAISNKFDPLNDLRLVDVVDGYTGYIYESCRDASRAVKCCIASAGMKEMKGSGDFLKFLYGDDGMPIYK